MILYKSVFSWFQYTPQADNSGNYVVTFTEVKPVTKIVVIIKTDGGFMKICDLRVIVCEEGEYDSRSQNCNGLMVNG